MKNLLTIYKFNLPFLDGKLDKIKSEALINDLRFLFLEDYRLVNFEIKNTDFYEITKIEYDLGYIELVYYKKNHFYFIPKLEINFYSDKFENELFEKIMKIFDTMGIEQYLFDGTSELNNLFKKYNVLDLEKADKNLENNDFKNLDYFLKHTPVHYIDDFLLKDEIIRNSFYYMIYISFMIYKNISVSDKQINEIEKLLGENIIEIYHGNLDLQKQKLTYLNDLNLVKFKEYKLLLDKLFGLLK